MSDPGGPSESRGPSDGAATADGTEHSETDQPSDSPTLDDVAGGDGEPRGSSGDDGEGTPAGAGVRGRREVEVPMPLFKVVTVFSTLLSVGLVVVGFGVLGMATTVVSNPPASLVVRALVLLGVPLSSLVAASGTVALAVALAGLGLVAAGAGVYVYGSRFRAPGMGKPKDEADEPSGDG